MSHLGKFLDLPFSSSAIKTEQTSEKQLEQTPNKMKTNRARSYTALALTLCVVMCLECVFAKQQVTAAMGKSQPVALIPSVKVHSGQPQASVGYAVAAVLGIGAIAFVLYAAASRYLNHTQFTAAQDKIERDMLLNNLG